MSINTAPSKNLNSQEMKFEEEKKDDPESSLHKSYPPDTINQISKKIQDVITTNIGC